MNRDWIQEAKLIAADLKISGFEDEPYEIINAIESGSTGGEILMALRWNIGKILKENSSLVPDIKKRMQEVVNGITKTLDT